MYSTDLSLRGVLVTVTAVWPQRRLNDQLMQTLALHFEAARDRRKRLPRKIQ
jgi:hypothetical protein